MKRNKFTLVLGILGTLLCSCFTNFESSENLRPFPDIVDTDSSDFGATDDSASEIDTEKGTAKETDTGPDGNTNSSSQTNPETDTGSLTGSNSDSDTAQEQCYRPLVAKEVLHSGEYRCSENGLYRFGMSDQGDLRLWKAGGEVLWSAGTCCETARAVMQADGSLVVYRDDNIVFSSGTNGRGGAYLEVDNDGRAVIRYQGVVIWAVGNWDLPACPSSQSPSAIGNLSHPDIVRCSGVVASQINNGVLWVINNNAGGTPIIYAFAQDGRTLARIQLTNASVVDWEDMATARWPVGQGAYLYIADIGDNARVRSEVLIYRIDEPTLDLGATDVFLSTDAERMTVKYPGEALNADTLLVDPQSGELAIVTKSSLPRLLVLPQFTPDAVEQAVEVMIIDNAGGALMHPLGGDVSPDGNLIVLKADGNAGRLWRRPPGGRLWDAFATQACSVELPQDPGGKAVAFTASGDGLFSVNEGSQPQFFQTRLLK